MHNASFHTKLAQQRSINVRIPMLYLDLLYIYLHLRKLHVRAATDESQKTLNKCETRNKTVFDTRLRHPETINSVPLNSVLRIKQTCV